MTAHILTISERHLRTPGELASLADFTFVEGQEVDPKVVVHNTDVSLYCFNDESRQAILAQLPPGLDLTKVPFIYLTQGEQAERLVPSPTTSFCNWPLGCRRLITSFPSMAPGVAA